LGFSLKKLIKPALVVGAAYATGGASLAGQYGGQLIQQDAARSAANKAADQARQMQQDQLAAQVQINKDNASYAAATAQANAQTQLSGGTPRNSNFPMWQQFATPAGSGGVNPLLIVGAFAVVVVLIFLKR
jgi:hypothetical protein